MADIFDEVGEDLRRERMKKLWQGYGIYLIGAAVLIVLATAGWRGYEIWQSNRSASAGDAFRSALSAAEEGDHRLAADALVAFSSDAPSDYAMLARLRAATERAAAGETDTALSVFEATAGNAATPKPIRDLATLRAAMIAMETESLDQIRARLAGLDTADNAFRHSARELIAVAALKVQDYPAARAALSTLMDDPALPGDVSQRAQLLEEIVTSAIGAAETADPEPAS